jgi:hypothetical protein
MSSKPKLGGKNKPAQNAEREPNIQATNPNPTIPPTLRTPQLPPTHPHYEITCKPEKDWWEKFKPFVELGGLILLAVYTGYTIKMYCANKQAADAAKSAVVDVQRAFITVDTNFLTLSSEPSQINSQGIEPQVLLENAGTTPTRSLVMDSSYQYFSPGTMPANFSFPDLSGGPPHNEYLGPKAKIVAARVDVPMSTEEEIADGKKHLFIWGWATYKDIFRGTDPHVTKYCVEIVIKRIKGLNGKEALITNTEYCRKNNCTDDDCKTN